MMTKAWRWIQNRLIHIGLVLVISILTIYLASPYFRNFLGSQNIDPNFLIGFFTVIALLLSIIQSGHDKRYGYNLSLTTAVRSAGERVIGKAIAIRTKADQYEGVVRHLSEAIKQNKIFIDQNNIESKEDVVKDMESVAALVDMYFPDQGQLWNDISDKLTEMANISNNIYTNYQTCAGSLKADPGKPSRDYVETLTEPLNQLKSLNEKIQTMTETLRNEVVNKINKMSGDFKETFRFRL